MLSDTHPEAQRVQIELLRRMAPEERLRAALGLTAAMVNLSRETIAALNPDLDSDELNLKCVGLYYGKELASRLRAYLQTIAEHDHVAI
jgi:hypothetical protein